MKMVYYYFFSGNTFGHKCGAQVQTSMLFGPLVSSIHPRTTVETHCSLSMLLLTFSIKYKCEAQTYMVNAQHTRYTHL